MTNTDDFEQATELSKTADHHYQAILTKAWALWGPAGGYLAALALRAAGESTEFTRPISMACQYFRVARFEAIDLVVTELKRGKRSDALRVDLVQDTRLIMSAQVWAGASDTPTMEHDYVSPVSVPEPIQIPTYETVYPDRPIHPFMARIESRPIDPIADQDQTPRAPELSGLYRYRVREVGSSAFIDYGRAMILMDTFAWLATYPAHPGPSPWIAPNLDFYYRFHRTMLDAPWLYMHTRAQLAHDSVISAEGEIRNLAGELLVSGATSLLCSNRPEQFR